VINRVLKEADGEPVRELTLQGGQFNNKRAAIDLGGAVTPTLAGRFNAVYENSDSYRDFVNLERYGINPTVTLLPNDSTKVQLSYEYFHDRRTTDRGILRNSAGLMRPILPPSSAIPISITPTWMPISAPRWWSTRPISA
jgi:outer membrane receptor for monomeric catechols